MMTVMFILALFVICLILAVLVALIIGLKKPVTPSSPPENRNNGCTDDDEGPGFGQTLLTGLMLGSLLDKPDRKQKSLFDSARDELFWQEKYRRHDDPYDGNGW